MSKTGVDSVTISNVVYVDMIEAVSIVNGVTDGGYTEVNNSVIIGRSLHSYCDPADCGSVECRSRKGTILGAFREDDETVTLLAKMEEPLDDPLAA